MKKSFADILAQVENRQEQKIQKKITAWTGHEGLEFISQLSIEQCSSSECAEHKLKILSPYLLGGKAKVVDLTCGLGVDSWALSKKAVQVISYERNSELAAATARNMERLGVSNIEIRNEEVGTESELPECDIIFADPARRDNAGKKVFKLEDCSPDICTLLPTLRAKAATILFKLSPMADISILSRQLGEGLKEIHIVSLGGEVKELLCLIVRGFSGECRIHVDELHSGESFTFSVEEESSCESRFAASMQAGSYLLEPCAALLKSGAFKLLCREFGIEKLDASTHLYCSAQPSESGLFKSFKIEEVLEFSSASIKELKKRRIKANVTARNLPLSSDELRKKIAALPGSNLHIFACSAAGQKLILICSVCK